MEIPTELRIEARIDAIELFLQQMVFMLEVEPHLTHEKMAAWLIKCRSLQRDHQVTSAPVLAAFGNLIDRVLEVTPDPLEPDDAARQAAYLGMRKAGGANPPGP